MHVSIRDVHDSHGIAFTLYLRNPENPDDQRVIEFFQKYLTYLPSEEGQQRQTLYAYEMKRLPDGWMFAFVDANKVLAKVDGWWNSEREDQKYVVLMTNDRTLSRENPAEVLVQQNHYCYYCEKVVVGIHREVVDVYDTSQTPAKKLQVSVHMECEAKRQIKIAQLFPYKQPLE